MIESGDIVTAHFRRLKITLTIRVDTIENSSPTGGKPDWWFQGTVIAPQQYAGYIYVKQQPDDVSIFTSEGEI